METLTITMSDRDEEAAIWPEATPEERLNSTAVMLLIEYVEDANDIFYIHFTTDNAASKIIFRTGERPEVLRKLRQVLDWIPEVVTIDSTI